MDEHPHVKDRFGTEERDPLVVDHGSYDLRGVHQGTICVHAGCEIIVVGTQQGTLTLRPGSTGTIHGKVQGTVCVERGAQMVINGTLNGSVYVARDAIVSVAASGKLAGSLTVDGTVENRGIRGGPTSGAGRVEDIDGGQVKQATVENGVNTYRI
jgi:hypothetical protein